MFDALASTLKPTKKPKRQPTSTVTTERQPLLDNTNIKTDPPIGNAELAFDNNELYKCDLIELNPEEDKLLSDILTQTEKELGLDAEKVQNAEENIQKDETSKAVTTHVQQNNLTQKSMPIVPRMYLCDSNVTINYHFTTK